MFDCRRLFKNVFALAPNQSYFAQNVSLVYMSPNMFDRPLSQHHSITLYKMQLCKPARPHIMHVDITVLLVLCWVSWSKRESLWKANRTKLNSESTHHLLAIAFLKSLPSRMTLSSCLWESRPADFWHGKEHTDLSRVDRNGKISSLQFTASFEFFPSSHSGFLRIGPGEATPLCVFLSNPHNSTLNTGL